MLSTLSVFFRLKKKDRQQQKEERSRKEDRQGGGYQTGSKTFQQRMDLVASFLSVLFSASFFFLLFSSLTWKRHQVSKALVHFSHCLSSIGDYIFKVLFLFTACKQTPHQWSPPPPFFFGGGGGRGAVIRGCMLHTHTHTHMHTSIHV